MKEKPSLPSETWMINLSYNQLLAAVGLESSKIFLIYSRIHEFYNQKSTKEFGKYNQE